MSFDSEVTLSTRTVIVARPPRLARWLAWCIRVLAAWPVFTLWLFAVNFERTDIPADFVGRMLLHYVPYVLAWLCLPAAGLTLRYWRRAMGLRVACLLIWLAPLISICDLLLRHPPAHGVVANLMRLMLIVLQCGVFHAAGFTAFLLDNPRLRDAYGLRLTGFERQPKAGVTEDGEAGMDVDDTKRPKLPAWLVVFCCFLVSPLLLLVPLLSQHHIHNDLYWQAHPLGWQVASLAFVAPPVFLAIGLIKYRHANWLRATMLLLIGYWLLAGLPGISAIAGWRLPGLDAIGTLPQLFGFKPGTAFAWIAYFRTAPGIRARFYNEPVAGVDVGVF